MTIAAVLLAAIVTVVAVVTIVSSDGANGHEAIAFDHEPRIHRFELDPAVVMQRNEASHCGLRRIDPVVAKQLAEARRKLDAIDRALEEAMAKAARALIATAQRSDVWACHLPREQRSTEELARILTTRAR